MRSNTDEAASPFDTVSSTETTQRERYLRKLNEFVIAPSKVVWSDLRARVGLAIVLFYVLVGTVGVLVVQKPSIGGPQLESWFVSMEYPLGTDQLGQSLLALTVHATPAMLLMLLSGGVFTTVLATVFGTVAGYKGGYADWILTTFNDVAMSIPGLPLVLVVAIALEPSHPIYVGMVLSINAWAGLGRSIRSQVLALREESYVEAAHAMGVPTRSIITRDLLPNLMPYIAISFVQAGRQVIFGSVALYFIGALPFNQLNWGVVLNQAYSRGALYTPGSLHWIMIPIIAILFLVLGLTLFAQGTERIFNPRIRARHADAGSGDGEEPAPTVGAD